MFKKYYYDAIVTGVYDGDSMTVDIDLGFGVWLKGQKIRLYGIDTPELRGEERECGLIVRDYVRDLILGNDIIVNTIKDKTGKYGRWLAVIYYDGGEGFVNLNEQLLLEGRAKPYE